MHCDAAAGMGAPESLNHVRRVGCVHGTVSGPEQQMAVKRLGIGVPDAVLIKFEDVPGLLVHAQIAGGVPSEVHVRQKEHVFRFFKGPLHHDPGVGGCADGTAKFSDHGLERHVGVDVAEGQKIEAALLELREHGAGGGGPGHERHPAVRVRSRQKNLLPLSGQQRGGFSHEGDAAEHDEFGVHIGDAAGEFKRVTREVAVRDDGIALIVMPHDAEARAEAFPDFLYGGEYFLHEMFPLLRRQKRLMVKPGCGFPPDRDRTDLPAIGVRSLVRTPA